MGAIAMKILPYDLERPLRGLCFRLTRRLADRPPCEVWPGLEPVPVLLCPFAERFGNVKRYELLVLCAVARHLGARTLFEFGTFDGLTTWHLAANCGPDARLWTLDLPPEHPERIARRNGVAVGARFAGTEEGDRIEQLFGDSLTFNPEAYRGLVDFCFIDANHDHDHVCRDTNSALVMVKPGGVIFWHDYSRWWPGVQRCLDDLSRRLPVFRVEDTSLAALQVPPS
jgi:hypothetical protein